MRGVLPLEQACARSCPVCLLIMYSLGLFVFKHKAVCVAVCSLCLAVFSLCLAVCSVCLVVFTPNTLNALI